MKNWRFSTNISLYFENGTRYGHYSYNRSIERDHFKWPSMTPNLDFNVNVKWKMVQDRAIVTTSDQYKVV